MQKASVFLFALLVLIIPSLTCEGEKAPSAEKPPEVVLDEGIRDTALLLGGVTPATNSALAPFAASNEYRTWAAGINTAWERVQAPNIRLIEGWRRENLTNDSPKTVFSPFSGPDILNAVAFFPHGNDFILFGMEPAGRVPRAEELDPKQLMLELRGLQTALGDILTLNFFQTLHMEVQVSENSCASFAGIIMFFLTRMDMEVIAGRNISIDTNGAIIDRYDPKDVHLVPGVEFAFREGAREGGGASGEREIKYVRYFSLDISDSGLAAKNNFEIFMQTLPECSTIIKSASFLMHKDAFSRIRALVLNKSEYVLQDDSAVPLRFFLNDDWTVGYYGVYDGPIPLFSNYMQNDLLHTMRARSSGRLPFSYGYTRGNANLIVAARNARKRLQKFAQDAKIEKPKEEATAMSVIRTQYDEEFKKNAVKLSYASPQPK